jgi:hypothetical protein
VLSWKILAVFFALLMVGITPACALDMGEMQKKGEILKENGKEMGKDAAYISYYGAQSFFYQFRYFKKLVNTFRHLKKKFEESKAIVNGIRDEVKAEKQAAEKELEQNKIDNKELLMYMAAKEKGNEANNKAPEAAYKDAKVIQEKLKEKGVQLKAADVALADLKNGTIVQVTKKVGKQVYVRYYTFEGITEAGKVKVYNGQEEVEYDRAIFNAAYTGLTFKKMKPTKEEDITEINSVTSMIYQVKFQMLKDKLTHHQKNINIIETFLMAVMVFYIFFLSFIVSLCIMSLLGFYICVDLVGLFLFGSVVILPFIALLSGSIIAINKPQSKVKGELDDLNENKLV